MRARGLRVRCADGRSVETWTAGDGRPLLMLHGWGLDGGAYREALHGFACAGWRVVAPTTNVPVGRRWTLRGLARRLDAVCDALGIASCPVVGHSFGGVVGARLALDHPSRVSALVVANAALVSPGASKLCRLGIPGRHYRLAADARVLCAFARAQRHPRTLAHLVGSVRWMLSRDLARDLPTLRERAVPAAVLWAEDTCLSDTLGRRAAEMMGARFRAIRGEGEADGPDGDHVWPLRNPEMFVEHVTTALAELAAAPSAGGSG